jgi:cohesin complex subunit SA-1/2
MFCGRLVTKKKYDKNLRPFDFYFRYKINMAVNGSTRSMRQHVQRSLGDDFVEPPASVMSTMPNEIDDDDDEGEEFQPKAATRGRTTNTPGRGRGRPSRTGPKTSATVNQGDDDSMETSSVTMTTGNNTTFAGQQSEEKGYFHHLLAGKTNIQVLVDQWIDSYQANRDEALIELMQFFLDSSGCKGKLTQTMYLKMEHVDMLRAMTEHFDEDTSEYPIIMSGLQYKKFRSSFSEFVVLLIKQASYSIIYDQYMIDNLVTLLTALSDSPVRAFRHTGTLAGKKKFYY